jgi:hypothetical protein
MDPTPICGAWTCAYPYDNFVKNQHPVLPIPQQRDQTICNLTRVVPLTGHGPLLIHRLASCEAALLLMGG